MHEHFEPKTFNKALVSTCNSATITNTDRLALESFESQSDSSRINRSAFIQIAI